MLKRIGLVTSRGLRARALGFAGIAVAATAGCTGRSGDQKAADRAVQSADDYQFDASPVFLSPQTVGGWKLDHQFTITNRSQRETMHLGLLGKSCGCTECLIDPPEIAPHHQTHATMAVKLPYLSKHTRQVVKLSTNSGEAPLVTLTLEGDVYQRIAFSNGEPLVVSVAPGKVAQVEMMVTAHQPVAEQPAPLHLDATGQRISIHACAPLMEQCSAGVRKMTQRCIVRAACPTVAEGAYAQDEFRGEVSARHGDYHTSRSVEVRPATAIVVSPRNLFVHNKIEENPPDRSLMLTARRPFAITGIGKDGSSCVRVEAALNAPALAHRVHVTIDPRRLEAPSSRESIIIQTDHPEQNEVRVPVFVLSSQAVKDT